VTTQHPTIDQVSDLVEGVLPASGALTLNAHIAGCTDCARLRDDIAAVRALLADTGAEPLPMPDDVAANLHSAIAAAARERAYGVTRIGSPQPASKRLVALRWLGGAAAAVVVTTLAVAGLRETGGSSGASNTNADRGLRAPHGQKAEVGGEQDSGQFSSSGGSVPQSRPLTTPGVVTQARRLAAKSPHAYSLVDGVSGCATPQAGPDIRFAPVTWQGRRALLVVDLATKIATVVDCATAKTALYQVGF
jgi:hypothetical protein